MNRLLLVAPVLLFLAGAFLIHFRFSRFLERKYVGNRLLVVAFLLLGLEGIFTVGIYPWVLVGVLFYALGAVLSLAGVYFLFLDVERTITHLKKEAETDFLTGLYNRKYFIKALEAALHKYGPHRRFAVAILDVDNMKEINDRLGHQKGDEVLEAVGGALKKSVGPEDIVARYGGDEFAILFRSDGPEVKKFPERLAKNLVFNISEIGEIPVSISVGLAFYPDDGEESGTLVAVADRRMYKDKLNFHRKKDNTFHPLKLPCMFQG